MMRHNTPMENYHYNDNSLTIIYFRKGQGSIACQENRHSVKDDSFIITNPSNGWIYENNKARNIDVLSIVISEQLMKEFVTHIDVKPTKLLDTPNRLSEKSFFFIENVLAARHYPSGRLLRHVYDSSLKDGFQFQDAQEIALLALQSVCKDQQRANRFLDFIEVKKASTKVETLKRLMIAREYIHDNIDKKISLDELSSVSCLSKFHLFNSFRIVFRYTPHQYSNIVKLDRAKELLIHENYSVGEISSLCGFNDIYSFSRLFKKKCGVSPTYFAKRFHSSVSFN